MTEDKANFKYGFPIEGPKVDGETPVYRHRDFMKELGKTPYEGLNTMQDIFNRSVDHYPNNKMLGTLNKQTKQYEWISYKQVSDNSKRIGSSILKQNLYHNTLNEEGVTQKINLFGVYSKNREEWLLLEVAGYYYNYSIVPLYDTLGQQSIQFIMEQTQMNTIYISGENIPRLLKLDSLSKLENVVSFDNNLTKELTDQIHNKGLKLSYFKDLLDQTTIEEVLPLAQIKEKDIYSFCYTSGTTGNPKGVLQTHENAVSFLSGCAKNIGSLSLSESDVHYSYLPLPHVYERQLCLSFILSGGSIGFSSGDLTKLNEELCILKPTVFASVPRIFNRYYSKIKEGFHKLEGEKKEIVDLAIKEKLEAMRKQPDVVSHEKWDELVFKDVRSIMGGKVRGFVTGGAALSGEVAEFLKIAFSCCFNEGYGQTESFGGAFNNVPFDGKYGNVGGIQPSMEFKLVDIPEMDYTSKDVDEEGVPAPRGEVHMRGHQVCLGYYKDEEKTKQTIDSEGWLHTGDVAQLMRDNSLKLIDRKGNLFKLSQGEYVAPEKIENIYSRAKGVTEAFVYGEALRSYLVALIVIDPEYIIPYAKQNSIEGDLAALCSNELIIKHVFENIIDEGRKALLNGIEQVKGISLDPKALFLHGVTTNTFKIKRNDAKQTFKHRLQELYAKIDEKLN